MRRSITPSIGLAAMLSLGAGAIPAAAGDGSTTEGTAAPTTATTSDTTPTTWFPEWPASESDPPNPLTQFPRRPGAKYGDVERSPAEAAVVGGIRLELVEVAVVGRDSIDESAVPFTRSDARTQGLAEAFDEFASDVGGEVLHVALDASATARSIDCVLLDQRDGNILLPVRPPAPTIDELLEDLPEGTTEDTAHFWMPIGERRGRMYLECTPPSVFTSGFFGSGPARVVWGIDV